jgi:hypothetical protein
MGSGTVSWLERLEAALLRDIPLLPELQKDGLVAQVKEIWRRANEDDRSALRSAVGQLLAGTTPERGAHIVSNVLSFVAIVRPHSGEAIIERALRKREWRRLYLGKQPLEAKAIEVAATLSTSDWISRWTNGILAEESAACRSSDLYFLGLAALNMGSQDHRWPLEPAIKAVSVYAPTGANARAHLFLVLAHAIERQAGFRLLDCIMKFESVFGQSAPGKREFLQTLKTIAIRWGSTTDPIRYALMSLCSVLLSELPEGKWLMSLQDLDSTVFSSTLKAIDRAVVGGYTRVRIEDNTLPPKFDRFVTRATAMQHAIRITDPISGDCAIVMLRSRDLASQLNSIRDDIPAFSETAEQKILMRFGQSFELQQGTLPS